MIDYHRLMLGDTVRTEAFLKALRSVIRPGQTRLVDIGAGTGFLSFLARSLGAKSCTLYEVSADLAALAQRLARENRITGLKIRHLHSTHEAQPATYDVVLSETLGNFALEENILETLADAKRFLAPGGVMIPGQIEQFCAPVSSPRLYQELNVWDRQPAGLTYAAAAELAWNNVYVRRIRPDELWSGEPPQSWDRIALGTDTQSRRSATLSWTVTAPTTWYGFAVWWNALLVPGVVLSTAPEAPATHWEQIYVPVGEPLQLQAGETVTLRLRSDTRYEVKIRLQWTVLHRHANGSTTERSFDMWKGYME